MCSILRAVFPFHPISLLNMYFQCFIVFLYGNNLISLQFLQCSQVGHNYWLPITLLLRDMLQLILKAFLLVKLTKEGLFGSQADPPHRACLPALKASGVSTSRQRLRAAKGPSGPPSLLVPGRKVQDTVHTFIKCSSTEKWRLNLSSEGKLSKWVCFSLGSQFLNFENCKSRSSI